MPNSYVKLRDKEYRVEFNWNTIANFLKETGQDEMTSLVNWKLQPSEITAFLHCALKEGARLDGTEFDLSIEDLGTIFTIPKVYEFLAIFNEHMSNGKAEDAPTTKKKTLFRGSGK